MRKKSQHSALPHRKLNPKICFRLFALFGVFVKFYLSYFVLHFSLPIYTCVPSQIILTPFQSVTAFDNGYNWLNQSCSIFSFFSSFCARRRKKEAKKDKIKNKLSLCMANKKQKSKEKKKEKNWFTIQILKSGKLEVVNYLWKVKKK